MHSLCNSSTDSASPHKDSCGSHVSIYYEQNPGDEEELIQHYPIDSCSSEEKIYVNPPVEIHGENTTSIDLPPLTWHGYNNQPRLLTVTNTGRTILINGHWTNSRPYIEGGPLNGTYLFSQIHFHCPSEHEIDGKRYPLEMHIVHYKTSYLTQERAMNEKDGTLVLAYLFKCREAPESVMSHITRLAPQLEKVNCRSEISEICLDQFIRPFTSNYYLYWGSVSTKKNCYLLQWIINGTILGVTQQEVEDLSNIITCTIGVSTVRYTPRVKPENDAIYHVGEDLPILSTFSTEGVCGVCKCQEVPFVSGYCRWRRLKPEEVQEDGVNQVLVCRCQSRNKICSCYCRVHGGNSFCTKCKSFETDCTACGKGRDDKCSVLLNPLKLRSRKSRGRKRVTCEVEEGPEGLPVLSCKSANESSLSSLFEEKPCIKRRKSKRKKKSSGSETNPSDRESEKSSSKSSAGDDKSKDKTKKAEKSESEGISDIEPCVMAIVEEVLKREKAKKDAFCQEVHEEVDIECEKSDSEFLADNNDEKKRKKKKELEITESLCSLKKNPSNHTSQRSTDLQCPNPSSSTLPQLSLKLTENDAKKEENISKDSQSPGIQTSPDCEPAKECSSTCVDKEKKTKPSEDVARKSSTASRTLRSMSKVRASILKSEGPECETAEMKRSKSKSPILDSVKRKMSTRKGSNHSEGAKPKSKASVRDSSQSKTGKNKKDAECDTSKSVQEVKYSAKKSSVGIENAKPDSKSVGLAKKSSNKLQKKQSSKSRVTNSKEGEGKGKSKPGSAEPKNKEDSKHDITTLFEKKQDGKKGQTLGGEHKDLQVNFLLSPDPNCKSILSYVSSTSELDFTEEKAAIEEKKNCFVQDFTVNATPILDSDFTSIKGKKSSQVCLLMEHIFRTENPGQVYKCSSQEYHVAVMYDHNILQEYQGKFHPQELQLGNYEMLQLVPRYPEPENSSFQLQDCTIKKESLDQVCIRVKFLLKELDIRHIFANPENEPNCSSEKKIRALNNKETQCNSKEFGLTDSLNLKSLKEYQNDKKITQRGNYEILCSNSKSKKEEKQNEQSKCESSSWEKATKEVQKYAVKPQSAFDIYTQDASESSATEELFTESNAKDNKVEATSSEQSDKKLKPLFVKRRKTVYFMYDKVEKDESTGKKVFVGSFRTKEEVEDMKKQKKFIQENEDVNANEKVIENSRTKYLLSFQNKEAGLEVVKLEEPSKLKSSLLFKKAPSTSQGTSTNEKQDVVTLHKYKPKYAGMNRFKKECKNVLIGKVVSTLSKDSETFKNLAEIIGVDKEKAPKISVYELQGASESEGQKENADPETSRMTKKSQVQTLTLTKDQIDHSKIELTASERARRGEEDIAKDQSQKSFDKRESQAALILIPVEVESLSKIEVILIEHLGGLKKTKELQ